MQIKLLLFASYREIAGSREMLLDVPEEATAGEALARLVERFPSLGSLARVSRCVVNQEYVSAETVLRPGDEVTFLPPVSGGDSFEITDRPLSAEDLIRYATAEAVGGIATFIGVVRRFSRGKRVSYLEYEAYQPMAEKKLAETGAEMRRRWPIERVAISHRVGRLEIGDVAVVIAVGAAHRAEAFEACRYAIEEIKRNVPVWKKEVWEDGEVWVGREGA